MWCCGTNLPPARRRLGEGACLPPMSARQVVLQTPSRLPQPIPLLFCQHLVPVSPLAAALMDLPASIANKRLTPRLTPLDATLTKNRGVGTRSCTSHHSSTFSISHFPSPNSYGITSLAAPHPLTPIESNPYKNSRGEECGPFSAPATKLPAHLCFHSLTNCPFSIPFVLTFIHVMGGCTPLPVKPYLKFVLRHCATYIEEGTSRKTGFSFGSR